MPLEAQNTCEEPPIPAAGIWHRVTWGMALPEVIAGGVGISGRWVTLRFRIGVAKYTKPYGGQGLAAVPVGLSVDMTGASPVLSIVLPLGRTVKAYLCPAIV